jgi:hypothetical protein
VLWGAWSAGGALAVAALKPIAIVLVAAGTGWAARTLGARVAPACVAAVLAPLLIFPWISERPQLASYVLFPIAIGLSARAVRDGALHVGWLAGLVVTIALWANLHSVALFGVVIVSGLVATTCVVEATRGPWMRPLVAGAITIAATALATLATPYGLDLHRHSLDVRDLSTSTMSEWYPLVDAGGDAVLPIVVSIAVIALLVWGKAWRRLDVVVPFALTLLFTIDAIRSAPFLVIMGAIAAATVVPRPDWAWLSARRGLVVAAVVAASAVALVSAVQRVPEARDPGDEVAVASTDALPAGCQLRNDYRLGGWVLFDREEVPVSADGRNDLYGLDGYAQNAWFESESAAERAPREFASEGTDCVLAQNDSPLPGALEDAGWTVVERDKVGVVLVAP